MLQCSLILALLTTLLTLFFLINPLTLSPLTYSSILLDDVLHRIKRSLVYLASTVALRNRFASEINNHSGWNTTNSRTFVRCLDLVLQSMYHLLSERRLDFKSTEYRVL